MLVLGFLMVRKPPVLTSLQLTDFSPLIKEGINYGFKKDL